MKWKGDKKHSPPSVPDMVYWSIEKSDRTWISVYNIKTKKRQYETFPPNPNMISVVTSMYNGELCPEYLEQNKKEINWQTLII